MNQHRPKIVHLTVLAKRKVRVIKKNSTDYKKIDGVTAHWGTLVGQLDDNRYLVRFIDENNQERVKAFNKEQVEEKINKDINEIFRTYGIKKINYQYCGNKLFSYIIKKFKSGHYYTISFEADESNSKNITSIQKRIKENQDVLRAISIKNPYENNISILSKLDANINQKDFLI